ncbi:MAG: hypothetical protein QM689_05095 [Oscillospiraceae bacterium]
MRDSFLTTAQNSSPEAAELFCAGRITVKDGRAYIDNLSMERMRVQR